MKGLPFLDCERRHQIRARDEKCDETASLDSNFKIKKNEWKYISNCLAVRLAKGEEIALGLSVLGALYRDLSFIKNEMRAVIFKSKVLQMNFSSIVGLGEMAIFGSYCS